MANANALQKPLTPSAELSAVIGPGPHTRAEAMAKLWRYTSAPDVFALQRATGNFDAYSQYSQYGGAANDLACWRLNQLLRRRGK